MLTYHCDCQYYHNGDFKYEVKTQGEHTPVIVYSLGDTRTIYYRRLWLSDSRRKWVYSKRAFCKYQLEDNSIFVLHPSDEKPMVRNHGEPISQFQHGNVSVAKGTLSIGLIYRNVTQTLAYDHETCTRILTKDYLNKNTRFF